MKEIHSDVLIIGGGLTGLMIGYLLRSNHLNVHIIEARQRLGGRIHTTADGHAPLEMGATWLGKKHIQLVDLLKELKIESFEQILGERAIYEPISTSPPQLVTLPPNSDPSFRIKGGSSSLIEALAAQLDDSKIHLGQVVEAIQKTGDRLRLITSKQQFDAAMVVSTLPPYLLTESIAIQPALPDTLLEIAQQTHTWMGESIKVSLTYQHPFWRGRQSSGTIFSNVGPIPEMYDHSNQEDTLFALKGFFNGSYYSITKEERLVLVLRQLEKYYGEAAKDYLTYEETVWRNEPFTFTPYNSHLLPHQNNGHQVYQQPYLEGSFLIAGSETASAFPGYMEGAIRSARFASQQIEKQLLI